MSTEPGDPVPQRVPGLLVPMVADVPQKDVILSIDSQPAMISRSMLRLDNERTTLLSKINILRAAITKALADSESQAGGWGPDVTVCTYLRKALKDTE